MADLDIANVISVNLNTAPQGLAETNVNKVALFTNETPGFIDEYQSYLNSRTVGTDFGTSSLTYKMANAIFSQSPNILSGGGELVIIPMLSSGNGTFGTFTTADISSNVENFANVSDGEFRINLNGTNLDVTGLDFSNAVTIDDIAEIIKRKLNDVFISTEIGTTDTSEAIVFTSKKVGDSSDISFTTVPAGSGTSIISASYLNTAAGTAVSGVDATGETLQEAIARMQEKVDFTGIITTLLFEDEIIEDLAEAVQSLDKLLYLPIFSTQQFIGIAKDIVDGALTKTRFIGGLVDTEIEDAQLRVARYASRAQSVDFNGSNTLHTMNLKNLVGDSPDNVTQTIKDNAETAGVDLYVSYGGLGCVASFGSNDFFDNVYSDLWLKNALQVAGFNYLRETSTKVPQTETGIEGLKGSLAQVMERGVTNGSIGLGLSWNSSETFGNPEDLKRNIISKGYYQYSLPIAQQSQAERDARTAPLIQIAFKRAGAIHDAIVNVFAEN